MAGDLAAFLVGVLAGAGITVLLALLYFIRDI